MEETSESPAKKTAKINLLYVGIVVILIIVAAAAYFLFFNKAQSSQSAAASQKDAADLVAKVSRLIDLPQNEKPTIATVTDKSKLASQAFFDKAENGDRVLIYPNNREAILYRPSTDKVINFTNSVDVGGGNVSPTVTAVSPSAAPSPSVAISPTTATKPLKVTPTKAATQ